MGIDEKTGYGIQAADMGLEILKGKNVKEVKMIDHEKINIIFNKMTADNLKQKIPDDLFTAAYRIYTDYKGTFEGQK